MWVAFGAGIEEAGGVEVLEELLGKPFEALALCVVKVCSYHLVLFRMVAGGVVLYG